MIPGTEERREQQRVAPRVDLRQRYRHLGLQRLHRRAVSARRRPAGSHLLNGTDKIPFSGRIGRRALKPGAYKATLRARDAKGGAKPVTVKFSIVR